MERNKGADQKTGWVSTPDGKNMQPPTQDTPKLDITGPDQMYQDKADANIPGLTDSDGSSK